MARAREGLLSAYALIDRHLEGRTRVADVAFSMADCAAPALFYAVTYVPMAPQHTRLASNFDRLMDHLSVARTPDLGIQRFGCAPFVLGPTCIDLQRQLERIVKRRQFAGLFAAPVLRWSVHLAVQPLCNRVAREPCHARYLALRFVLPGMQMPDPEVVAVLELARRALAQELQQKALFDSPKAVREYLQLQLGARNHEVFAVLFLDSQNRLIALEELFRGTLTQTSVYPREVVLRALHHHAAAVVLAHNHPSGEARPSRADEALTQSLKAALALVDVRVLDHFIVTREEAASMAELGLI